MIVSLDRQEKLMEPSLRISVVDPDEDYLGIEVAAASTRFAGTTRIYAGLDELSTLASRIERFPTAVHDERQYEFGSTEPGVAGGFARLRLFCVDGVGHAAIEVTLEDDTSWHDAAFAKFSFHIAAGDLDRFVARLRDIEQQRYGEAILPTAV